MSNMRFSPVRTCVACRKTGDKSDFLRIVKQKDGRIFLDLTGKSDGRGAYVCDDQKCIDKLVDKKMLSKAFSENIPAETYLKIKEDYANSKG